MSIFNSKLFYANFIRMIFQIDLFCASLLVLCD